MKSKFFISSWHIPFLPTLSLTYLIRVPTVGTRENLQRFRRVRIRQTTDQEEGTRQKITQTLLEHRQRYHRFPSKPCHRGYMDRKMARFWNRGEESSLKTPRGLAATSGLLASRKSTKTSERAYRIFCMFEMNLYSKWMNGGLN